MKIDLKDKKILHELDNNARISFSEISKRIRLSKNSVINRVKQMEKDKIILGYNALININSLGYTTYDIYLRFKGTTIEKEQEIIDKLVKNKSIWLVAKVEGNVNLSLLISTKTPEEFNEIWLKIYEEIKPYVEIVRLAILLEYHHFSRGYLTEKRAKAPIIIGKRGNNHIDQFDEKILKYLAEDARLPILELSHKLRMNPKSVALRIRNLEKNKVILGYKINLNFGKLGYNYYKIMFNLSNLRIIPKFYEFIKQNNNVVYYDKFIGGEDFEFDLEINSLEKFLEFIETVKKEFGDSINKYDYINPTIIFKSSYFSIA